MSDKSEKAIYSAQSDEITLKELILKLQEFFWEVVKYWKILFLLFLISFSYFLYQKETTPTTYPAKLSFMLNDDGGGGQAGVSMILGSLGLGGFKGKGEMANLEKIMQLFKTRVVIDNALMTPVVMQGQEKKLANHIMDVYGFQKLIEDYGRMAWAEKLEGVDENYQFSDDVKLDSLNEQEEIILKILYDNVVGNADRGINPFMSSSLDEDSEIMTLRVKTLTEDLTIVLIESIYNKLSNFFIEKAIEKQQKTFDIVNMKTDSIRRTLTGAEYALADFRDSNRKLVTVKGYLRESELERQVKILSVMFAESIKNLEIADFALRRRKPYVQLIDTPMRPLPPIGKSLKYAIIYSFLIASVFGTVFIVGRKIIRDAMQEN